MRYVYNFKFYLLTYLLTTDQIDLVKFCPSQEKAKKRQTTFFVC